MGKYLSLCPKRGKNKKIYGQRLGKYQIRNGGHFFSFRSICSKKKERPDCDEAQKLVAAWQRHITEHYYDCFTEMLAGLGQMYQQDPRFLKIWNNMEKIAPNLQVRQSMFTAKKSKAFLKSYYPHIKNSSICWSFLLH